MCLQANRKSYVAYNWATFCNTDRLLYAIRPLSCLSVCDVGVLWPNGWMDQNETWHEGRPRPRPHRVKWGPSSPPPKGAQLPNFGPCLLWPNGWMDQDATWYGDRPHWEQQTSPPPERGTAALRSFRPMSIAAKRSPISATADHLSKLS